MGECDGAGDSGDPYFDVLAGFGSGDVQDIFADVGNAVAFFADGFDVYFQFFAFFDCRTLDFGLGFAFSDRAFGAACFAEKHLDTVVFDEFGIRTAAFGTDDVVVYVGGYDCFKLRFFEFSVEDATVAVDFACGSEFS